MSVGGGVNLSRDIIADALIGGGTYDAFDDTNGHLGVGNSTTAHSASQTDLEGSSTVRIPFDAGYPQRSSNVISFEATADGNTGNFAWNEWALFNALNGGEMLCRFVADMGTKASGAQWKATGSVTVVLAS